MDQDMLREGIQTSSKKRLAEIESGAVQAIPKEIAPGPSSTAHGAMKYEFHPAALQGICSLRIRPIRMPEVTSMVSALTQIPITGYRCSQRRSAPASPLSWTSRYPG